MGYISIPRAEHDFMYVSAESDVLLTFWLLEDTGAIAKFAYLIGDGKRVDTCSFLAIRSDGHVTWNSGFDGEHKNENDWYWDPGNRGELEEVKIAYSLWKKEIENIILGEEYDIH